MQTNNFNEFSILVANPFIFTNNNTYVLSSYPIIVYFCIRQHPKEKL
ncbi:hypothetical protein EZS27_003956 [termite gut metagenome]|uniref:Uncharacterized protein n=1 Tax=termite gut metagenome TaxID=433724 RepID=A0A5J4SRH8_9ZZZZ